MKSVNPSPAGVGVSCVALATDANSLLSPQQYRSFGSVHSLDYNHHLSSKVYDKRKQLYIFSFLKFSVFDLLLE